MQEVSRIMKLSVACITLLIVSISLGHNTGNEFLSNRFTRPETYAEVESKFSTQDYMKVAENENLQLFVNPENTSIRVVDNRTGYVWGDVLETERAFRNLNESWKAIARSALLIEYYNERGIMTVRGSADRSVTRSFSEIPDGVSFHVVFEEVGISLNFSILLEENCVVFRLNSVDISEGSRFLLGSVVFAPFFGSTAEDEMDGYIFVPDGPGALVRFSRAAQYMNWFEKRVYGKDYGIENLTVPNDLRANRPNDFSREEPTVLMPVYGIVQGVKQNGLFGVISSGEEFASILAYPSGVLTDYNIAGVKFIYRQRYLQPTSRSGAGVQVVQKEKNKFDAELKVFFLVENDADYVGMAKLYREVFEDQLFGEIKTAESSKDKSLPLAITLIASDIEKRLIGYSTRSITTTDDIGTIAHFFREEGVDALKLFIEGWQKGGIHGNRIAKLSFENRIGGQKELIKLVNDSVEHGYDVYLVDNVTKVSERQINLHREVGINLSQSSIFEERDNKDLWLHRFYYSNVRLASKYIEDKSQGLAELGFTNLAIREYGNKLYGDMRINNQIPRNQALDMVEETLKRVTEKGFNIYLFSPNSYAWKYTQGILETPMNNSQYLFETDTVPFLQIVLSGRIEYYTPYINNSFFSRTNILKAIEYGAYPSFILTWVDNFVIKDTPLWDYPSTKFDDWYSEILQIQREMSNALNPVISSRIVGRTVFEPGVVKVDYENGWSIIVNYTEDSYDDGKINVPPLSWKNFTSYDDDRGDGDL